MALPLLILIPAAIAAVTGVGSGIHGGIKMKRATKKIKKAEQNDKINLERLENTNMDACKYMDILGRHEMQILASFGEFSDLFSRMHNRPEFKEIKIGDVTIPAFNKSNIEEASIGASVLLGGLGGAALGTAGAFAASSATTAAVMALGTASTGTAIASLSGVAATNATLAALGGGSLAAGGGGMALGSMVLGGASLGVSLLIGGVIFSISGSHVEKKADKAMEAMQDNERQINKICAYLNELIPAAKKYNRMLMQVNALYTQRMSEFRNIVSGHAGTINWESLSLKQQQTVEALVLLVGVLYEMCKVQLVKKSENPNGLNKINHIAINRTVSAAKKSIENL